MISVFEYDDLVTQYMKAAENESSTRIKMTKDITSGTEGELLQSSIDHKKALHELSYASVRLAEVRSEVSRHRQNLKASQIG